MVGLRSGKSATAERQTEIETSLSTGKDALHQADGEVDALREKLAVTSSRLRSLNEIHERFEGVGAGAQAVMTGYANASGDAGRSGLVGLVADRLECAGGAHAGARRRAWRFARVLARSATPTRRCARPTTSRVKRRAARRSSRVRRVDAPRIVPPFPTGVGIVGPLLTLVRYSHADEAWVRYLLFDVLVVDTLRTAARLHREGFQGKLVTLDGQALLRDGAVVGGAKDESATHLLRLKREIRELEEAAASEGAELERATANQGRLRANHRRATGRHRLG